MKKLIVFFSLALFVCFQFSVFGQESGRTLYIVAAGDETKTAPDALKKELESRFDVYNRLFRFDPSLLSAPLNVKVFGNRAAYDAYVKEQLGETKHGAIYLHYNDPARRELVVHRGSPEEASMLAHQAFVQYIRAFIPNPPAWILDGFAVYYSSLRLGRGGNLEYEENLLWLETVKSLGEKMPSAEEIFLSKDLSFPEVVLPEAVEAKKIGSWALVSFLLNGGRDHFRNLVESFMLLSPDATAAENTRVLARHFSPWIDIALFEKDFKNYIDSRKTYRELMDEGHAAYSRGDTKLAELSFLTAMDQKPSDYAPYYYLGLLAFEGKNYDSAKRYYESSLERGGDEALINYALGVNASAAGRKEEAVDHLYAAAAKDPSRFRARVNELIKKILP